MKVSTKIEREHFISFVEGAGGQIKLADKKRDYYVVLVKDDQFTIHEDTIIDIKIKHQHINVVHRIMQ